MTNQSSKLAQIAPSQLTRQLLVDVQDILKELASHLTSVNLRASLTSQAPYGLQLVIDALHALVQVDQMLKDSMYHFVILNAAATVQWATSEFQMLKCAAVCVFH